MKKHKNKFKKESLSENSKKLSIAKSRKNELYDHKNEIRSEFYRDYTRILHSQAYRRLKHKTQVFFRPKNDHICTRIEHVNHVDSISYSISKFLGLDPELTRAIAIGHDLGHAPFGNEGESILHNIANDFGLEFWHEKNSLNFVDNIELLQDHENNLKNLNLTYAVRDGIVMHCGEVDQEQGLKPRTKKVDLKKLKKSDKNEYNPFTWEGCIVKITDKIAYLGRDIEDAFTIKLFNQKSYEEIKELRKIIKKYCNDNDKNIVKLRKISNSKFIHNFVVDLCKSSNPYNGIKLSDKMNEFMEDIKQFNYKHIYKTKFKKKVQFYIEMVIYTIVRFLNNIYEDYIKNERGLSNLLNNYNLLMTEFKKWLIRYSNYSKNINSKKRKKISNLRPIYNIRDKKEYIKMTLDFVAGMTDNYAIRVYNEINENISKI